MNRGPIGVPNRLETSNKGLSELERGSKSQMKGVSCSSNAFKTEQKGSRQGG